MVGKWKIVGGGLVVLAVLAAGYIYACGSGDKPCDMDMSGGGHDKHNHSAGKTDAAKTPENLIKQADKLIKEADKTKDVKPLMTHCQAMLARSLTMMAECNRALKGENPDMAKLAGTVDTANKLMVKSTELTNKCLSLMPKPEKVHAEAMPRPEGGEEKGESKTLYVCPMGDVEPQAEPGKCPKCDMNLEKKK